MTSSPDYPGTRQGFDDALAWLRARRADVPRDVVPPAPVEDVEPPAIIMDGGTTYVCSEPVESADGGMAGMETHSEPLSGDHR